MANLNIENEKWNIEIDRAKKLTLQTAGKFVDRDIEINVPHGEYTLSVNAVYDEANKSDVSVVPVLDAESELSIAKSSLVTAVKPAEGVKYYEITPKATQTAGSILLKASAATEVTKKGFVEVEDAKSLNAESVLLL